jgi:hypothetical protein
MLTPRTCLVRRTAIAALATVATAVSAPSSAGGDTFLGHFATVTTIASTVPANGDVNPYGIVVVEHSVGALKRGNVLVSNFNNVQNLQGTGTTIVQISPAGVVTSFATIESGKIGNACPGGVGLTTALSVLDRGWVIVGSLPAGPDGTSAEAKAGCLIVLDPHGSVVETLTGEGINGPWDMTSIDFGDDAFLFVTTVLNGNVTQGADHLVHAGTVLRIGLEVPEPGYGVPRRVSTTVIGSGFDEIADPAALIIGPTGVALSWDGTLYVADTHNNRIAAIPDALFRKTSALTGRTVSVGGALNGPLGMAIAPNGDLLTANAGDGNLVETTPGGNQVAVRTADTATGAGSLFGVAVAPGGKGVYFVDDGDNTLKRLGAP